MKVNGCVVLATTLAVGIFSDILGLGKVFKQDDSRRLSAQPPTMFPSVEPTIAYSEDSIYKVFETIKKNQINFTLDEQDGHYYLNGIKAIGPFDGAPTQDYLYHPVQYLQAIKGREDSVPVWLKMDGVESMRVLYKDPPPFNIGYSTYDQLFGFEPFFRGTGGRFVGLKTSYRWVTICQRHHLENGACNSLGWYHKRGKITFASKYSKKEGYYAVRFKNLNQPFRFEEKWRFKTSDNAGWIWFAVIGIGLNLLCYLCSCIVGNNEERSQQQSDVASESGADGAVQQVVAQSDQPDVNDAAQQSGDQPDQRVGRLNEGGHELEMVESSL